MKPQSKYTTRILAYKELNDFTMNEVVDWAVDMLIKGYETPSLLILAGLCKPVYFFEAENYLVNAFSELKLAIPNRKEAIWQYCQSIIFNIAKGEKVKDNLHQLYKMARLDDEDNQLLDFYLLYWAWDDLDAGQEYQHYWPDAKKENIEVITINEAQKYLSR